MKLQVLMFYQDDPKKCTAAKMVKFGLAQNIKKIGSKGLVLDPFSEKTLLPKDKSKIHSIIGIDCSWNLTDQVFSKKFSGIKRKLPPLLAGNPVNYSKLNKLTTVEALAGQLQRSLQGARAARAQLRRHAGYQRAFSNRNR